MKIVKRSGILGILIFMVCCNRITSDTKDKKELVGKDSMERIYVIKDSSAGRSFDLEVGDAVRNYCGSTGGGTKARPTW